MPSNEALQRDAQQRRTPLPADGVAPGVALALLSAREREVMQLALQGLPSKLIAKQLCLSHRTVEHHRSRLLEKLGVASMAELMRLNYKQALDGSAAPPR
jgi:DNA-binding NarL/FixJ family response regulator